MVRDFLDWWLGQLADIVPERWRRLGARDPNLIIIEPATSGNDGGETVAISVRHNGSETLLGEFTLDRDTLPEAVRFTGDAAVLRLAERDVLGKTLVLPLAAERDLEQVLAFEMDRETPFTTDEVFWSGRILQRNRMTGQLSVALVVVPRTRLQRLLAALERAAIRPARAHVAAGPYQDIWLPLDGFGGRHRIAPGQVLRLGLAAAFGLIAAVAVVTPFARQSLALAPLERRIAGERAAATQAGKLREQIERLSGSADAIAVEREKSGRPLAVLAALTRLLPADTYLTDLTLQQGKVTLTGRSSTASRLIAIIAADAHLHNPSFAAPITRTGTDRLELFTIMAEVTP